jgi:hypothetical protein
LGQTAITGNLHSQRRPRQGVLYYYYYYYYYLLYTVVSYVILYVAWSTTALDRSKDVVPMGLHDEFMFQCIVSFG